jgi:tetratricopeptide (TPR) repeat protein
MTSASTRARRLIAPLMAAAAWAPLGAAAAEAERCAAPAGRVAAVEGRIEVASAAGPALLAVGDAVCLGDVVRAARQVAIVLSSGAVLRLDRGSELRVDEEVLAGGGRTFLDLLFGRLSVFSRRPHALEVGTPFANAAVEGTEFAVEVERDRSRVAVLEGRVRVSNPQGSVRLEPGGAAVAVAGRAPEIELRVRPRDAVRWALYYPPLGEASLPPGVPAALREAGRLESAGERSAALARLAEVPPAARDATYETVRAELLLGLGRVEEAEAAIAAALAKAPEDPDALALRAVLAVVRNEKGQALADARRAVAADPANARARLALSYAAQASFDIPLAREQLEAAVEGEPRNALAWARLAEIRLAEGDTRGARRAAERAVALDPAGARAWTVQGFAALARTDTSGAKASFGEAIRLDPFAPLARLGLGLATVRGGDLAAGRESIELAVALDPGDALLRSYLGRAYFGERRDEVAGEAFATAKALDPSDPTPWFYDAIRKQQANRPVEALREIQRSIALSDRRAVYRSPLLLEEDRAARGASLARTYTDLGFEQLGVAEAARALTADPLSAPTHRFLADLYLGRPRLEAARVSELLQAQLLARPEPLLLQPSLLFPDLDLVRRSGPETVGFAEYAPLFDRDGVRFAGTGLIGTDDTLGDEVALGALVGRTAFGVSQFHYETDGFRPNNGLTHDIVAAMVQSQLTEGVGAQLEWRRRDSRQGDRRFDIGFEDADRDQRLGVEEEVFRAGLTLRPTPADTVLLSGYYVDRESDFNDERDPSVTLSRGDRDASQVEAQWGRDIGRGKLLLGAGWSKGRDRGRITFVRPGFAIDVPTDPATVSGAYAFAEGRVHLTPDLDATARLGIDHVDQDERTATRLTPGLGLAWRPAAGWEARLAAVRGVKRPLPVNQSIFPTTVAGFNTVYDDLDVTVSDQLSAAVQYRLSEVTTVGVELQRRWLSQPFPRNERGSEQLVDWFLDEQEEDSALAYAYRTLGDRASLAVGARLGRYAQRWSEATNEPVRVTTASLPAELRWFGPGGLFYSAGAQYFRQQVEERFSDSQEATTDSGLLVDLGVGYRFPRRRGALTLTFANVLDRELRFQDDSFRSSTDPEPLFAPERSILLRLSFVL